MEPAPAQQKRAELRQAVLDLRERGLYDSAKWAAEQLAGLPQDEGRLARPSRRSKPEHTVSADDEDSKYLLAKSYFDVKEYRRAAYVLNGEVSGPKALFLRSYALYLAGEKRREEERVEKAGPFGQADTVNTELEGSWGLEAVLRQAKAEGKVDAFCLYMLGLVLIDREKKEEAREVLLESLTQYPCNWGAWMALAVVCPLPEVENDVALPRHWMRDFYLAHICVESHVTDEALGRLQALSEQFPSSDWVLMSAATAHYHLRNFDEAQELFEDLLQRDPHRMEGMDTYSNILYVKEQFAALSHLAHRCALTEKYSPESCCIIGNYYSLKGQHEKAVLYFRRALKLNRNYLAAWTLMGHEFIEMKNPSAAIEAYRWAVEINERDFRAWYGLGQAYELLGLPYYALHYFRRATKLRLSDARMWVAMGQCYENDNLKMDEAAKRCYRRALHTGDREGIAMHKLAKIHEKLGELDEAARFYAANLQRIEADNLSGSDVIDALLFLASYKLDNGELVDAEALAVRLLDFGAPCRERAKALLREIHSRQQRSDAVRTPAPARGLVPVASPDLMSPSSDLDLDTSPG